MPYSYKTEVGDGVTRSFVLSFEGQDVGYIEEEDVVVFVNGNETAFSFTSPNTIALPEAPVVGAEILIRRIMDKDRPYADFKSGNNFGQEVMNNSFLKLLYIVHELLDGYFPEGFTMKEAVTFLEGLRSLSPDPSDPHSVVTFGSGDDRYVNVTGDTMEGSLLMATNPIYVRAPVSPEEPSRKGQLDEEVSTREQADRDITRAYQSADANLQAQLTGNVPLEASAFSVISWHDRVIENSVIIPPGVNAWSFGPVVETAVGQSVTVGEGSTWVISDGQSPELVSYDGGIL